MTWRKTGEVWKHGVPDINGPASRRIFARLGPKWHLEWIRRRGIQLYDQIKWVGDDLFHEFDDPADYPDLSPKIVEDANRPWRASFNMRRATVPSLDQQDIDIDTRYWKASARMAASRYRRTGNALYARQAEMCESMVCPPPREPDEKRYRIPEKTPWRTGWRQVWGDKLD